MDEKKLRAALDKLDPSEKEKMLNKMESIVASEETTDTEKVSLLMEALKKLAIRITY